MCNESSEGEKMEKLGKKKLLTCNKKQTCHVGGKEVTSHLLPALPEVVVMVVGAGARHIIRNELRLGCKEGALDALRFYEAASRTERTVVGLALNG